MAAVSGSSLPMLSRAKAEREAKDRDLPMPKRPVPDAPLISSFSSGFSALASTLSQEGPAKSIGGRGDAGNAATARLAAAPTEKPAGPLRFHADLLRNLPVPLGPLPRQLGSQALPPAAAEPAERPAQLNPRREPEPVAAMAAATATSRTATQAETTVAPSPPAAAVAKPTETRGPTGSAAWSGLGTGPSDRTAQEPAEAMEQRMYAAAAKPVLELTGPPPTPPPAEPTPPTGSPMLGPARTPTTAEPAKTTATPAAVEPPIAEPPAVKAAAPPTSEPKSAAAEATAPASEPTAIVPVGPAAPKSTAGPAEVGESVPELAEPPRLPMGWIIGALLVLALLLTLWIAFRSGVFGPPSPPLPIDPINSTPPRMP